MPPLFIAKNLTLIGLVLTVGWFFWNPVGWEIQWEPLVVFVLTLAGYVSAEAQSVFSSAKKKEWSVHDVALFDEFIDLLPSSGVVTFLETHDFFGDLKRAELDPLKRFRSEWQNAEHEFVDVKLESCRKQFCETTLQFLEIIERNFYTTHLNQEIISLTPDRPAYAPDEWSKLQDIASNLNQMSEKMVELHQNLIRTYRHRE